MSYEVVIKKDKFMELFTKKLFNQKIDYETAKIALMTALDIFKEIEVPSEDLINKEDEED